MMLELTIQKKKTISCLLHILAVFFLMASKNTLAQQASSNIVIIADKKISVHNEIIEGLHKNIGNITVNTMSLQEFIERQKNNNFRNNIKIIISLGTNITAKVLELKLSKPLLSIAIPQLSYQKLAQQYKLSNTRENPFLFSAIYLDQPLSRNLNLIQEILPSAKKINIALGPDTFHYGDDINHQTKDRGLILNIAKVDTESTLIEKLNKTLIDSDVMLGIIDPLVFSRTSAHNILLTTYRWRVPLIGISPAYVNTGALAAIYSSPDQLGEQLAETIKTIALTDLTTLPKPQHPKSFKVSVNYRVAEAMGIQIIEEDELLKKLELLENDQRFEKTP